ncbi:MAG TPA: biotin--[acetyl-CoA-carboxylase] ligase [Solirubrobacteraceae bacterium]
MADDDEALPRGDGDIALGRPRVHLRQTDSTNVRARELASAGALHGTLVTASVQSAGRGRQGRRWSAPANSSLLMSLILRSPTPLLGLVAAVAVCDVADRSEIGLRAQIKWPNDIVLARAPSAAGMDAGPGDAGPADAGRGDAGPADAGRRDAEPKDAKPGVPAFAKLAGILVEGRPQAGWAVLGIGLNVAVRLEQLPDEPRAGAATLGYSPDAIEPLLERLLVALARRLAEPEAATLEDWRARDVLYGREIAWSSGGGRAAGIDGAGHLIVALADGTHITLDAGEIHLRPVG